MADVDGSWACTVASPMGDQDFTLTVISGVIGFTGSVSGGVGTQPIDDGDVDGGQLTWTMAITSPMAITLTCSADIAGDTLTGKVKAGIFGSFPLRGRRA